MRLVPLCWSVKARLTLREINYSIRISSCGIVDVLMHDAVQDMMLLQQEDLTMFGRLVFALCCNNISAASPPHFQKSLELIGRLYSADVKNVALFLISKGGPHRVRFSSSYWEGCG